MNLSTRQNEQRNSMPQFGLRTIMLLIAVAAVWTAYYTGRKSIKRDLAAIESMHALAPELFVRNQNEYACLQIDRLDHVREYQCYLPPGQYNLHLLWSKEFALSDKTLEPELSATMAAGEHQVLLDELPDKLIVTVDGKIAMDVPRERPESSLTSFTGARDQFNSQWYPLSQPLTLVRLRESSNGLFKNDAGPGFALWIEKAE
jgi:hypothetical protein